MITSEYAAIFDNRKQNPIIQTFHISKRYGTQIALRDVNLTVEKNEFLFITGPSGAGKTTLLRLLFLDEQVSEGQILVNGINLQRIRRARIPLLRRKIGVVFQDFRLIKTYTVYENVALVLEAAGKQKRYIQKKVRQVLRMVGLEDRMYTLPPRLSGGEQQRVALARAAAGDPLILLADEPTGNLDAECADMVFDLLRQLHTWGTTVIVATHDTQLLEKVAARIVFLRNGTIQGEIGP
ncbi:MAG: cell division ATP-binding protein FtsE [Deltaproteobacteria bacterium]|nr:MAG: cell division ATP-binding protein FtsE [Deltaproteobacteria bacterium]